MSDEMMRRADAELTRRFVTPEPEASGEAAAALDAPSPLRDQAIPADGTPDSAPDSAKALAVYLLHLAGFLTSGLTNLVAVILAYVLRDGADPVTRSHLQNGATIFWGALVFNLVAFGLAGAGFVSVLGLAALSDVGVSLDASALGIGPIVAILVAGGALLGFYAFVWFLVRTIKGLVELNARKAYANPSSWGF